MAGDSIVGRATELAALGGLVEAALRGAGAVAAVIGEAGIGKSRLLAEVSAHAQGAGLVVLAGRAVPGGGTYRALATALVGRLREVDLTGDAGLRPYRAALGRVLPDFGPPARAEAAVDQTVVVGEAVVRLLRALGAGRGALLVLDDLHWADPDTLAVVEYLIVEIMTRFVSGTALATGLTWLYDLYAGLFRDLAQASSSEPVSIARDPRHGMLLHIRRGTEARYECHVDSAPITGLFYITDHPVGRGGELVVANRKNTWGAAEVEADATRIHPVAGQLLFFDGREHTHYIAPLMDLNDLRISIAMTFFTVSCPEDARPTDLDEHLGLV